MLDAQNVTAKDTLLVDVNKQKSVQQIEIYTESSNSDSNPYQLKIFLGIINIKDPHHPANILY